jgi:peptidoglycan hydrolase-like protein with peptidoglycan-binding domain
MMNRKQQECRSDSGLASASPRRSLVRRGRIVALASVLAVAPMITGFPQIASQAQAHPVNSQVREVGFVKSSVASMRAAKDASRSQLSTPTAKDPISTARSAAVAPAQGVAGEVTVVGVTWPKGAVTAGDQYQIRTLTGSTWSQWQSLKGEQEDGPDPAEAASAKAASGDVGTSPYIVTGASKYQVRSLSTDASVPSTAKVQVVDPGTSSADTIQQPPGAAAAAAAKPTIRSRASWGANEKMRRKAPAYGRVLLGFVHHTDSSNSYSASSVPAMIRGMYAYHVRSLGWNDIGYNFLVDRFGRTWEGRYGGVTKAVVGAQTMNYNAVSTGVSAIGNFQNRAVPVAMTTAFKRILAWKLSLHRVPTTGRVVANGKSFQRISGHRDGFPTACPGRYLYAKLPTIRAGAAAFARAPVRAPVLAARRPAAKATAPAWARTRFTPYKAMVLRQGSRGTVVRVLQRALGVPADGAFGARTRAAVVAFQGRRGIARNGVVGLVMWNRIEKGYYPLIAYRMVTLRYGSRGAAVVAAQRALRVPASGVFRSGTFIAVRAVQSGAGLARTGVISGWTWVAIENRMRR